jgi:glycerol-3-phosphate acyltransferase PlsY
VSSFSWGWTLVAILAAYFLGSIPFALLVAKARGVDLRAHGSGNLGATNAIRVLGPFLGVPVLLADVLKGFLAASVLPPVFGLAGLDVLALACGAAAILGHVFSVFLRFRGGKGVATACGVFVALAPAATGVALGVFGVVLLASRYVSLASIAAALALPSVLFATNAPPALRIAGVAVSALVIARHRSNLSRLLAGTESRVRFGAARKS